jgi:ADP-ribose pyrophosphatase YjhB (NUDIX family)
MSQPASPWLEIARRLHAIAQTGLHFTEGSHDRRRYEQVRELAAQLMAPGADADPAELVALYAREEGYATPKVDVRGVVFDRDRVLLVRERSDGGWTPPGGWADVGDAPSTAVEREVAEEAGLAVRATKLLACFDRARHGHPPGPFATWKLYFRCEPLEPGPQRLATADRVEISDVGWFPLDELPPLSLTRVTADALQRCRAHLHDPSRPTDFD